MGERPTVSVVVLPRSRGGPVRRSVSDALGQLDVDVEILLPGIPSPAESEAVQRLDVAPRAHPADVVRAALRVGCGEWFALFEVGDRWHPDHLRRSLDAAAQLRARWCIGTRYLLDEAGDVTGMGDPGDPRELRVQLRLRNVIGGPSTVVCQRSLLVEAKPFEARFEAFAYWAAWQALAVNPPACCTDPLVAERADDQRPWLDPCAAIRETLVLRREDRIADHDAIFELACELEARGHRYDAARAFARSAVSYRRPRAALRALAALRTSGKLAEPIERPGWLA